jgi:hypothetical protein
MVAALCTENQKACAYELTKDMQPGWLAYSTAKAANWPR